MATGLLFPSAHVEAQIASLAGNPQLTPLLIDVRTPQEFGQEHLSGAINIENTNLAHDIRLYAPDKNAPIELYCRSGYRASQAEAILRHAGYSNVKNIGGLENLKAAGRLVN